MSIADYRGGITENIRIAGRTKSKYGILAALGYFVPIWAVMMFIGACNASYWPGEIVPWIFIVAIFLILWGSCRVLIDECVEKGRISTRRYFKQVRILKPGR